MEETRATVYRMNPAEDRIIFGDQLTDDMLVLAENPDTRTPRHGNEDDQLRSQRFRRVTRLHRSMGGTQTVFVGEWVDGYQQVHTFGTQTAWLVKNPREEE